MNAPPSRPLWAGRTLALLGILLVALNLRSAVAALSPIVAPIRGDIELTVGTVGVLGMLPPVCFALFGLLTPAITRRLGLEAVAIAAMVAIILGHLGRALAPDQLALVLASILTFAGLGVGNVLLPPLVKRYFPDRIGLVTTVYVSLLSVSTFLPAMLAVPVAESAGWRVSLGMWAVLAVAALLPWIGLVARRDDPELPEEEPEPAMLARTLRSPLAWSLAVVFGVSSLNAYAMFAWLPILLADTAGSSPAEGGLLLALFGAAGLPSGIAVPWLAARMRNVGVLVYAGVGLFLLGYAGLLFVPQAATWLWVLMIGFGPLLFPLALVLINLRTRTHAGAVALSGFTQGVGYLIGALGPIVVGALHEITGGWSAPIVFLAASAIAAALAGSVVARPHLLEDERR